MNEMNPKYENARKIHRLLTNQNPGFLQYKQSSDLSSSVLFVLYIQYKQSSDLSSSVLFVLYIQYKQSSDLSSSVLFVLYIQYKQSSDLSSSVLLAHFKTNNIITSIRIQNRWNYCSNFIFVARIILH
jgi:hypothetical protein